MFAPFGPQLTVESVRPIVADAKVEPIDVLEIPTAGRPADYRGAVVKYHIVTEASPIDVKAGDPIKLLVGIAGTGPMELVQAPPLAELPALTTDFKVPNEPLAGYVQGDRKVFSTTIRPRKEGITEIPADPVQLLRSGGSANSSPPTASRLRSTSTRPTRSRWPTSWPQPNGFDKTRDCACRNCNGSVASASDFHRQRPADEPVDAHDDFTSDDGAARRLPPLAVLGLLLRA